MCFPVHGAPSDLEVDHFISIVQVSVTTVNTYISKKCVFILYLNYIFLGHYSERDISLTSKHNNFLDAALIDIEHNFT